MDQLRDLAPDAEIVVREASPRPAIVDAALELRCQMIVMGTHGGSALAHLLLGSVAECVVRNSVVPVIDKRRLARHARRREVWFRNGSRNRWTARRDE
jgi:hypothetical protein